MTQVQNAQVDTAVAGCDGARRGRRDLRAADDVARSVARRIDREQIALLVEVAQDDVAFVMLAVIGRDLVIPVVVEIALDADDRAIGLAPEFLVANAEVDIVATDREAGGVGGHGAAGAQLRLDHRARLRRQIGIVEAGPLALAGGNRTECRAL